MITESEKHNILFIYRSFNDSLHRIAGRNLNTKSDEEIEKTYQYNFYKKFSKWAVDNSLDNDMIKDVIDAIVEYGHQRKLLNRGAAILSHKNICDIVIKKIDEEDKKIDRISCDIKNMTVVISTYTIDDLIKKKFGAYPTIVKLYDMKQINTLILAFSNKCWKSVKQLNNKYKNVIPTLRELAVVRHTTNQFIIDELKKNLGEDFIK